MSIHQNTNEITQLVKKLNNIGRCYHPLAPDGCCEKHIQAHSIQKSGLLKKIQRDGHVYSVDLSYGNMIKNHGNIDFKLVSVNSISTFKGFCHFHDSTEFKPIDDFDFNGGKKQAFLYAYRALCKTIFATENAVEVAYKYIELYGKIKYVVDHLKITLAHYNTLISYQIEYEKCLINNDFSLIYYHAFIIKSKPNVLFSTPIIPVVDFKGNIAQYPREDIELSFLTINSVPYGDHWVYLVTWHENSNDDINAFLNSLFSLDVGEKYADYLFRLAIRSENTAFSPEWWEGLNSRDKVAVTRYLAERISSKTSFNQDYLRGGVEGVSKWECSGHFSDSTIIS